jgi:hypothetical protein
MRLHLKQPTKPHQNLLKQNSFYFFIFFGAILMEKFMLIFRQNPAALQSAAPEQIQANLGRWMTWLNDLAQSGKLAGGEQLTPNAKVVTNKQLVTDGPFTEAKEIVGGFVIINAENIEAALEIAKTCPNLEFEGSVEVRQVLVQNS